MFCLFFFLHLHRCFICWSLNVITYISQHFNPCQKMQSHNSCKLGKNSWPLPERLFFFLSSRVKIARSSLQHFSVIFVLHYSKLAIYLFYIACLRLILPRFTLGLEKEKHISGCMKKGLQPLCLTITKCVRQILVSNHNKMCQIDSCVWCFQYVNWYSNWSIQWLPTNLFVQKGFSLPLSLYIFS